MTSIAEARDQLYAFVEREQWAGWDPFDGLNSELFQATPLRDSRLARLALLQFCKRSPWNFRSVLRVPKAPNNKGLGLFLSAACRLFEVSGEPRYKVAADKLVATLLAGRSSGYHGACWGYNFDWQARAFFQPKGTPTIVATAFIVDAVLDARETFGWDELLGTARSACEFVLQDLNRTAEGDTYCFSYSPADRSQVYNASMLASRLLARVGAATGEPALFDAARRSVAYVVARQREDGAWAYGNLPFHRWVDGFHTGFVLDCLDDYRQHACDASVDRAIDQGLAYYKHHFFLADGTPKYYDTGVYPIDAHSSAQAILTLLRFDERALAGRVAEWTMKEMWSDKGYFYYQKTRLGLNRIPYMRWVQAWMLRALAELERYDAERSRPAVSLEATHDR